jgi:hypothetical protein
MCRTLQISDTSIVEVDTCAQGFDSHRERLELEADARDLGHEALDDFEVQRVPFGLPTISFGIAFDGFDVQLGLEVQRADERIRVEEQLQQGVQQAPGKAKRATVRIVDCRVLERERWFVGDLVRHARGSRRAASEAVQKRRFDRARVQNGLETSRGQILNLLIREVNALVTPGLTRDAITLPAVDRVIGGETLHLDNSNPDNTNPAIAPLPAKQEITVWMGDLVGAISQTGGSRLTTYMS